MTDTTTQPEVQDRTEDAGARRWLFGATAALAAGGLLAACSSDDESEVGSGAGSTVATTPTTGGSSTPTSAAAAGGDAAVAKTAAGLEVLAVGTYKAALDAATAGKLGAVPPAVATFVQTAMGHHQQALDMWNKTLTSAGQQAVTTPPASLKSMVDQQFGQAKTVVDAAKLALLLEQTAASTYLSAIPSLQSKEAITLAGALQSVDQEHAAVLLFVLGQYPVPEVFQSTSKAFKG